jgi:hypothetical protein
VARSVDGDRPHAEEGLVRREPGRPFEHRGYTGDEHRQAERLGHIVVSPKLEAQDDIALLPLGRHHDDRDVGGQRVVADLLEDLGPRKVGEHDIHERKVGGLRPDLVEAGQAVPGDVDGVTLLDQPPRHQVGHVRFVFDDQDSFLGHVTEIVHPSRRAATGRPSFSARLAPA